MTTASEFDEAVRFVRAGERTADEAAEGLLAQLTDAELLWLFDGDTPVRAMTKLPGRMKSGPIAAAQIGRVGFPGMLFADGPRGVVIDGSTAFPVTMARAATWDPDLERAVGIAIGREARARGANYSGAVCVNLLRHPGWGRAQECYGEDPVLTGRMGVALTEGLRPNVMACVKHFALNSLENTRFTLDVQVDDHALHEVYLPHFKAVIDAGAESVMSAYNSVNGKFMDVNKVLLTDVLRDEWGFDGFVTSDWLGTHDAVESLEAGMEIEMPLRLIRARELPQALKSGRLSRDTVLTAARRIVRTIVRHYAGRDPQEPAAEIVAGDEHRALARHVATKGMVLLKNEAIGAAPLLPLSPSITRLAVIGALADQPNTGDHGSSLVQPPTTVSPLAGLREALPGVLIDHVDGSDPATAVAAAHRADAVILVVGMNHADEGERVQNDDIDVSIFGFPFTLAPVRWLLSKLPQKKVDTQFGRGGDRRSLTLHTPDERLIAEVARANPSTAVVLIGGSAIVTEAWRESVPAILHAWYPGMEGGHALADVLTGVQEPGGRLPVAIPTDPGHLSHFDSEARSIVYDASWGQRKLDQDAHPAAFPFGFGLGYTTFDMELLDNDGATARVRVRNTGTRAGSTVAQVYAANTSAERAVPQLVGFRRVRLEAGQDAIVQVELDLTPTRQRDPGTKIWRPRPGEWALVVAAHSPSDLAGAHPIANTKGTK